MCKKLHLKKKIVLWAIVFFACFTAFAQTPYNPYNVVMNIYNDPKTTMAFNWLTGAGVTGGKVQVMLGANIVKEAPALYTSHSGYTDNKVVVTGLSPGTTYSFRVGGVSGYWSSIGTFTTAKANKDPFSFIYVTDTQISGGSGSFNTLKTNTDAMAAKYPNAGFWLHCGDLTWDGGSTLVWNDYFTSQQAMFYKFPFAPIMGNHDIGGSNFKRHFNIEDFGTTDTLKSTYTYIYGDAQFFAINGEQNNNSSYITALSNWMRAKINAHPDITWRIVYFHKNIYTGNGGGVQVEYGCKRWFEAMTPLFDTLNIDIALQGHSHIYEVIGPVYNRDTVPGSVSNVQSVPVHSTKNLKGKLGGIFNVREGTLYFTNGIFGNIYTNPSSLNNIPWPAHAPYNGKFADILPDYKDLFTGRLAGTGNSIAGNSTYSHVSVSTDSIVITTYVIDNGNSQLLDEITIVKCIDQVISNVTYNAPNTTTTIKDCGVILNNVKVKNGAKLIIDADRTTINSGFEVELGSEFEIK